MDSQQGNDANKDRKALMFLSGLIRLAPLDAMIVLVVLSIPLIMLYVVCIVCRFVLATGYQFLQRRRQ